MQAELVFSVVPSAARPKEEKEASGAEASRTPILTLAALHRFHELTPDNLPA
jgi:hypothetical protein